MHDYIIVGGGICGSFLSYYLMKAGQTVLVIDRAAPHTASKVASGIINPVTGRRIVKTWLIDEVMPFALAAYTEMGSLIKQSLIRQCNVIDFFATPQMKDAFVSRMQEEPSLLQIPLSNERWNETFRFNYGAGEINPCYLTDIQTMLSHWRRYLQTHHALLEESFDISDCKTTPDEVQYRDLKAGKIIFCEGAAGTGNPYFDKLPYALNKGEALIAHIPGLSQHHIYKQGISIVPWKEKDLFWIGSNYLWEYEDVLPSAQFRQKTEAQLSYWLKLPVTIVNHVAAERPANVERRPFVGVHPLYPSVGILNGMGTKGCSLAPYFSHQLAEHLVNHTPITPLADVQRFSRILSR